MSRKDSIMEALIMNYEVRGELDAEGNAAIEDSIAKMEQELRDIENGVAPEPTRPRFTLWISGYSASRALAVERVSATEKAVKFAVPGTQNKTGDEYTFFMPKKALLADKNEPSIVSIAQWFTVEGYLNFLFDRFGSYYKR